jgi:hypothetical protein
LALGLTGLVSVPLIVAGMSGTQSRRPMTRSEAERHAAQYNHALLSTIAGGAPPR